MNDVHVESRETKLRTELTSFFSGLGPAIDIARQAQKEMDRRAATKFSIFDYFRVQETDLSRIFADLLDPSGSHGQGDRFLSLFLKETLPKETLPEYSLPRTLANAKMVHLEYSTHERRKIDIVLEMPDNHWIGIENKPWAEEQEEQVKAYIEYLQGKVKESGTAWILYLSGNGSDPQTLPDDPQLLGYCRTVPYRKNSTGNSLENWIEQCWRECEAEQVRWFLKNLLEYIQREFESKEENQVMAQDVSVDTTMKFILSDENHLALALEVEEAMQNVRGKLIKEVTEEAKKRLREWGKNEDWEIISPNDENFVLRRKGWPKQSDIGWDIGVAFIHGRLKVHLSDDTDVDKFKGKFEEHIGIGLTRKFTQGNSSLIEQQYIEWTKENLKKAVRKDDMANELTKKMKDWAEALDKALDDLK